MKKYHVLLKTAVNIRVANIEAPSMQAALEQCRAQVDVASLVNRDFHPASEQDGLPSGTVVYVDDGEEPLLSLVDEVGDPDYARSQWLH